MAWKRELTLAALNASSENTMVAHLGIVYTRLEEALLEYRRPGDTILVKASHFMGFSEIVKKLEQPQ